MYRPSRGWSEEQPATFAESVRARRQAGSEGTAGSRKDVTVRPFAYVTLSLSKGAPLLCALCQSSSKEVRCTPKGRPEGCSSARRVSQHLDHPVM